MVHEASALAEEGTLDCEVCIVGAGAAGVVIAEALMVAGVTRVVVLESGGSGDDARAHALNDGDNTGDPYAGLQATRARGVGGTALMWNTPVGGHGGAMGAKYVPLDAVDLRRRWHHAPDGWPFPFEELGAYYAAAERRCGVATGSYEASERDDVALGLVGEVPLLIPRVYKFGSRAALLDPFRDAMARAGEARLVIGATVVRVVQKRNGVTVSVADTTGTRHRVFARRVVLAAGAVENARILLLAQQEGRIEDRSGWLGRGFMEHPRDRSMTLHLSRGRSMRAMQFLDARAVPGERATFVAGRLGFESGWLEREGIPNASVTLLPNVWPVRERLRQRLGRFAKRAPLSRWLPRGGTGWSGHPDPDAVFDGFSILLNVEQPPHPDNAIMLGTRRDANDLPLPVLQWRWHPEDDAMLQRLRATVVQGFRKGGVGEVEIGTTTRPDPNAHHHAGTTRMHADARRGVVDAEGKVHGSDALYVAGGSLFPSAGFANPMLTIVAMSLRLADHLLGRR